ncbi:hypothetical protein PTTG_09457 [Puccinia triticina 1-1 BBBD Race 1]|uniref:Uncharacterized protein n=1 Tax=Puccinia triticina (isolate 1-1 / race 1 (BBBD)) TaxID=630390 RepID=A0A180GC97_PUCT1|nr:hypothetical protein PTTG_09457 [Puccinia triticina 1-1 BBBD Race 1]
MSPIATGLVKHADPVIDPTRGSADSKSSQLALELFASAKGSDWTVDQMPNLQGRIAIVTGGVEKARNLMRAASIKWLTKWLLNRVTGSSTGIGYATALELARRGAKVYQAQRESNGLPLNTLACRADKDTTDAIKKINVIVPGSNPQFLHLDITSLKSAHSAAHEFLGKEDRLDILVNNAGIAFTPYQLSEDGIELQLCNAIGHFAFTFPLLDLLKKTSEEPGSHVRIVNVASVAHSWVRGTPDFSSVDSLNKHSYFTTDRYGLSKLMNIKFSDLDL